MTRISLSRCFDTVLAANQANFTEECMENLEKLTERLLAT